MHLVLVQFSDRKSLQTNLNYSNLIQNKIQCCLMQINRRSIRLNPNKSEPSFLETQSEVRMICIRSLRFSWIEEFVWIYWNWKSRILRWLDRFWKNYRLLWNLEIILIKYAWFIWKKEIPWLTMSLPKKSLPKKCQFNTYRSYGIPRQNRRNSGKNHKST